MINIFVQTFQAVVFVLITGAGITAYIKDDNWFMMVMCVLFLFQGEKILRAIFGANSSSGTISDLATAGMAAYATVKSINKFTSRNDKTEETQDEKDLKSNVEKANPLSVATGGGSRVPSMDISAGARQLDDGSELNDTSRQVAAVTSMGLKRKVNTGNHTHLEKVASIFGSTVGAVNGAALGLAKGEELGNAIGTAYVGKEVGSAAMKIPNSIIRKATNTVKGEILRKDIKAGKLDKELGLDAEIKNIKDKTEIEAKRKACAAAAAAAARSGAKAAAAKFWTSYDKSHK